MKYFWNPAISSTDKELLQYSDSLGMTWSGKILIFFTSSACTCLYCPPFLAPLHFIGISCHFLAQLALFLSCLQTSSWTHCKYWQWKLFVSEGMLTNFSPPGEISGFLIATELTQTSICLIWPNSWHWPFFNQAMRCLRPRSVWEMPVAIQASASFQEHPNFLSFCSDFGTQCHKYWK